MNILLTVLAVFMGQQEVPYKPDGEFTVALDITFKQRPPASNYTYNFDETSREYEKRTRPGPTPYVILSISIDKIKDNETRLKVFQGDDKVVLSKKLKRSLKFNLDAGYTDDLVDQLPGHYHTLLFYDDDKNEVSRIVINFDKDGNYFVNGKIRGKV
ncbi:MAG: hypothetical protein M9954_14515 [Cyclobacteriaceae bacterium]|nr:hypothetical protein [Cyclobacteriaceae bacterium]MCB9238531.1 hypothetical protein [Flammeovirgaceae bacterium]MCB0499723.1 hypothetical protein [Cyclobacteriaceae bacterium]MCO5272868.1 hypothetical protein [Cyclobacteriaceae bacterium]MCW5902424.1 hypothetical protein [Cyclobacteriaceae bacterium]